LKQSSTHWHFGDDSHFGFGSAFGGSAGGILTTGGSFFVSLIGLQIAQQVPGSLNGPTSLALQALMTAHVLL
jgi:hypothetical protein